MRLSDLTTSKAGLRYLKVQKEESWKDVPSQAGPRPDHRRPGDTYLKSAKLQGLLIGTTGFEPSVVVYWKLSGQIVEHRWNT
jgi:hypothetical protein